MSNYHRLYLPGGSYFFTVVTEQRRPFLCEPPMRAALKNAMAAVRRKHPFHIAGMVLLPDHMHMVWTLPAGDSDYPLRVRLIKSHMTKACGVLFVPPPNPRRQHKLCGALWQHRYWEHALRSEDDFKHHLDYLHWNPVKHGLVQRVVDWPWSTFHAFVEKGIYPVDWCAPPAVAGYALSR